MEWLTNLTTSAQQLAPRILAALGLVAAGWLVATLLKIFAGRLVKRLLQRANRSASVAEAVEDSGMRSATTPGPASLFGQASSTRSMGSTERLYQERIISSSLLIPLILRLWT